MIVLPTVSPHKERAMCKPCTASFENQLMLDSEALPGGYVRYYADGDEELIHANKYVIDLFECDSAADFLELTQGTFKHFVYDEDLEATEESIWSQVRDRNNLDHVYYRIRTKSGTLVTVAEHSKLMDNPEHDRPIFEAVVSRVSPTGAVDWLTGLSAMARFHELARIAMSMFADIEQKTVALAFDIMGMKAFNTRYGRAEGDRLLRVFANSLRTQFGSEACSRFGEDHFYAFAPEKSVEKKVAALFDDFASADFQYVPPVRAGLYACDEDDDIVDIGFDRAKSACDLDRTTWQSHFTWFTDQMGTDAQLQNHVLENLDRAIAEDWIRPYYQPVVRSSTGMLCEEEALARWIDPEYGLLPPYNFIPVLEDASLLHRLDLHIVDCVLADFAKKRELGISIVPVSVNISYRDLTRYEVAHEIATRADALGVPHDLLHVEFTESAIHSDPELFMAQVKALHDAGFEVWLDDFGSGYSSLNVLQRYEFDVVKLDMEFLRGAAKDWKKARSIVAGIVRTTKRIGLRSLAEGVETEEQASFLESIGCDMLQGYLFSPPRALDQIALALGTPHDIVRELREEEAYWNALCNISLTDFSEYDDGQGIKGVSISEFPAGVLELRDGEWFVVRDNRSFGEFLERKALVQEGHSGLRINRVQRSLDKEFFTACERSETSGTWELIEGRLEYGSGFQFYTMPVSSSHNASAYVVVGVPTMLGTALGAYGDVPVGYAVFRVILSEEGDAVVDAEYVYANDLYRMWAGFGDIDLTGRSFLETAPNASEQWFPYCYRAAVLGEELHDTVYSPETGHWLSFHIAPSPIEGCCVYAFSKADDEHREREELQMGLDTSDLIIRIANALNGGLSYDAAMNRTLEIMSEVIHPERLYVFEYGETSVCNTFEWCAEGIEPQIETLQDLDFSEFETWERMLSREPIVLIADVEELKKTDPHMHWQLSRQGITHLLATPFYDGDQLIGYLGADNYMLTEDLDSIHVLEMAASFVGGRIANHRLMNKVERMATHDDLTGLPNRKGVDIAIAKRLSENEGRPYALALMDIDDFKVANDVCGHEIGDLGLRMIARETERVFPKGSVIGRNGSDEFVIMVFGDEAQRMGDCLAELMRMDLTCESAGKSHTFELSAGFACYPEQVDNLHGAYSKAFAALHDVKSAGKHGYVQYSA